MKRITTLFLLVIVAGCAAQPTNNDGLTIEQSSASSVAVILSASSSARGVSMASSSLAPYTGAFHYDEDQGFIGSITVHGFVTVDKMQEGFCGQNCKKFSYAFFTIQNGMTDALAEYLKRNRGNSFLKSDAIGLGCVSDLQAVDSAWGNILFTSTSSRPIEMTLNIPFAPPGMGAPDCYSHFKIVSMSRD